MDTLEVTEIWVCPHCVIPYERSGRCGRCGSELAVCHVGALDDPCRRPVMDARGRLVTRAPLWWLRRTAAGLARYYEGR